MISANGMNIRAVLATAKKAPIYCKYHVYECDMTFNRAL